MPLRIPRHFGPAKNIMLTFLLVLFHVTLITFYLFGTTANDDDDGYDCDDAQ